MMLRRKRTVCIMALIVSVLMLLSTSCGTCPETPAPIEPLKIKVEWPTIPPPEEVYMTADGIVSMPLAYWLRIIEYMIDVERLHKIIGEEVLK